ncbi:MAG: hypothetical protein JWN79_2331 [Gemmatimonadetes bacterium]|nr:hypothetical protein [Gemmatimonadota bacterium]
MSTPRVVWLLGLPALAGVVQPVGAQAASAVHPVGVLARPHRSGTGGALLERVAAAATDETAGRSTLRAAAGVGLGVVMGGFIGYFVSQVTTSDWADLGAGERSTLRQRYTVSGAAVGAISGALLRPRANHSARETREQLIAPRTGRLLLSTAELQRSIATNAYEAIELERPEWLARRGNPDSPAPAGAGLHAAPTAPVVYMGEERVGDAVQLRDVAIPEVRELRFYDSRDAMRRWRTPHPYGAIEVVPTQAAVPVPAAASPR